MASKTPLVMSVDGDVLTITIDLTSDLGPSKSGKSKLVASTNGNVLIKDGIKVGVTAFKPV